MAMIFLDPIVHLSLLLFLKNHSSCQRLGSHGTTAAFQAFPFVAATNGASACGFLRVRVCACRSFWDPTTVGTRNSLKNRGVIQLLMLFFFVAMLSAAAAWCLYHTASF